MAQLSNPLGAAAVRFCGAAGHKTAASFLAAVGRGVPSWPARRFETGSRAPAVLIEKAAARAPRATRDGVRCVSATAPVSQPIESSDRYAFALQGLPCTRRAISPY